MFYKVLKIIVKPIFYLIFGIKIVHKERLRYEGGMILIANHRSNFDPIFMHLVVKPKVQLMAKQELFKNPMLRWLVTALGAFPVERGRGDLGAIKNAFKILRSGGTLGIFPEGTRTRTDHMRPFQHGVAMIAIRTGAPILPIYFAKTFRPFRRNPIIVGEPIQMRDVLEAKLSNTEDVKQMTNYLFEKMQELEKEAKALCK